jgi:ribosome maturation factor RimP
MLTFATANEQWKGTESVPFFYFTMHEARTDIGAIEERVNRLLEPHPSHFLVEVRIKPTNNIKVFIDADEGMPLSALVDYNRKLYKQLEESGLYPDGNFSLEVSSPGLDEPLKKVRQYKKNVGRFVEVTLNDGTRREGKLTAATDEGIVVEWEEGKGKKKETKTETILFENIKSTKIQVKF